MDKKPRDPRCPPKAAYDCPPPINPCTLSIGKAKKPKPKEAAASLSDDDECEHEPKEEAPVCEDPEPTCHDVIAKEQKKKGRKNKRRSGRSSSSDDDDDDEPRGPCDPPTEPTCKDTAQEKKAPCC